MSTDDNIDDNAAVIDSRNGDSASGVPLFQTSRTGFNDRAWNDPPPGLMTPNAPGIGSGTPEGPTKATRPKLTSRVAFPLSALKTESAHGQPNANFPPLNPDGPPPTSGFVPQPPPK